MNIQNAIAKSIKSGSPARIQTTESALAIRLAVEAFAEIDSDIRIDDTKPGSDLSALKIVGQQDGRKFTLIAAGARF